MSKRNAGKAAFGCEHDDEQLTAKIGAQKHAFYGKMTMTNRQQ